VYVECATARPDEALHLTALRAPQVNARAFQAAD
jgi:hypothetical protein